MDYSQAYLLAETIKQSDEYKDYHRLKEDVTADNTTALLIAEYRKLQMALQVSAMGGRSPNEVDMQRFQGITALLYGKPEVSQYLLSEMRLQQALGDVFKILTDAAGLQIELPGI